jgi:SAM-dependent methyltransferase
MYNDGNLKKHTTKNPLKRKMVKNFNDSLIGLIHRLKSNEIFSLLDAGCGEGFVTQMFQKNFPNAIVTALDLSMEALTYAPKTDHTNYLQGNIYKLPFENKSFDFVLCSEVIEHLRSPSDVLLELDRVSAEWIICTVPNDPWFCLGNLLALKNISRLGNPPDHINHYNLRQLRRFVSSVINRPINYQSIFPWSAVYWKK